jgi:hypothetical protein
MASPSADRSSIGAGRVVGTVPNPDGQREAVDDDAHEAPHEGRLFPMPVLAPITRETHLALREAVLDFRETDHRRRPPPTVHVGVPGHHHACFVDEPGTGTDAALAADVVGALLQRSRRELVALLGTSPPVPLTWLTRAGALAAHDADVLWSGATRVAYDEAGLDATFVVVTRDGWLDPVTGARREWRRLRRRSGSPPASR